MVAAAFCTGDDVVCHPRIVLAWAFAAECAGGGVVTDGVCCLEVAACACGSAFAVVAGLDDAVLEAVLLDGHDPGRRRTPAPPPSLITLTLGGRAFRSSLG